MDPVTVGGLILGGLGSLASGAANGIGRAIRFREYLANLEAQRRIEMNQTVQLVGQQTAGTLQNARSSGARRAAAEGRTGDVESIIAPIEARAQSIGSRQLRQAMGGVDSFYRQAYINANDKFNDSPLPPNVGDVMQLGGEVLTGIGQNKAEIDAVRDNQPFIPSKPTTNDTPIEIDPSEVVNTPSAQTVSSSIAGLPPISGESSDLSYDPDAYRRRLRGTQKSASYTTIPR